MNKGNKIIYLKSQFVPILFFLNLNLEKRLTLMNACLLHARH